MNNLTEAELARYLHNSEGTNDMPGIIRTKEKCPVCGEPFQLIKRAGFICPKDKTTPKKFFIDLYFRKKRIKLYSTNTGRVLDRYSITLETLQHIQYEIRHHIFDPSKYILAEVQQFWISTLLDRFVDIKKKEISPSYWPDYQRMANLAKSFFGNTDVREIRKIHIINYKHHLENNHKASGKTLKNRMDHFKTFLFFCKHEFEVLSDVPKFPEIDIPEFEYKWLGPEDQIELFNLLPEIDKPIFAFLMLSGCRPGEARALKCKNVDLKTESIRISATFSAKEYREKRKGKRARSVVIPIHPELMDYISDRVRNNHPEAWLFENPRVRSHYSHWSLNRAWKDVCTEKKISGVRLYDATRHSFASQLINANVTLLKVSRLMGHSSIKMTEKYAHTHAHLLKADVQKLSLKIIPSIGKPSEISAAS